MIEEQKKSLIAAAIQASEHAYAPYSQYRVGAALLTSTGKIFLGCNVENASYGATICAERTAVAKAVSEGERDFEAIAVATQNGGSPCGICRQFMFEFSPEMQVIIADFSGKIHLDMPLKELLPGGFGPHSLP